MKHTSAKKEISITALITAIVLLLVVAVGAVIVCFCFPYSGYEVTHSLGMKKASLFFAERYAERGNIDGLVYCVELEDSFIDGKKPEKYAKKLLKHTEEFFEYTDYLAYFAQLDDYYVSNAPPALRIGLYSYNSYIVSRNYKARAVLGQCDEMIFKGKVTPLGEIFGDHEDGITPVEKAAVYDALSVAVKDDFPQLYSDGEFTDFYYELTDSVPSYIIMLEHTEGLETLYLMRSILHLMDVMDGFFEYNRLAVPEEWVGFGTQYKYGDKNLEDAYTELFLDYIKN